MNNLLIHTLAFGIIAIWVESASVAKNLADRNEIQAIFKEDRLDSTFAINSPQCGSTKLQRNQKDSTGKILKSLQKRIIGGKRTVAQEHPWMAYIYMKKKGKAKGFQCGGAVINNNWVVTAAHCLKQPFSPKRYGISFGKQLLREENHYEVDRKISQIVLHPNFTNVAELTNDIALLKIDRPIRFTVHQSPLCVPKQDFPTDATEGDTFAGRLCIALGWGNNGTAQNSNFLQQVSLKIMPHVICEIFTSVPTSLPYGGQAVDTDDPAFCAGGEMGKDTCKGDSGGPLICMHDNGRYYMHGVTSYGPVACGTKNQPGVYTRVSHFTDWIESVSSS